MVSHISRRDVGHPALATEPGRSQKIGDLGHPSAYQTLTGRLHSIIPVPLPASRQVETLESMIQCDSCHSQPRSGPLSCLVVKPLKTNRGRPFDRWTREALWLP